MINGTSGNDTISLSLQNGKLVVDGLAAQVVHVVDDTDRVDAAAALELIGRPEPARSGLLRTADWR